MRKLAWFAGGFGLACLLGCLPFTPLPGAAVVSALLCGLAVLVWSGVRPRGEELGLFAMGRGLCRCRLRAYGCARRLAVFLVGAALAFLWVAAYTALVRVPAEELAGEKAAVTGTVISLPRPTSIGGWSVTLRLSAPGSADVLLHGNEEWGGLELGDTVRCTARLERSDTLYGDETAYYSARGVYLLGYCEEEPQVARAGEVPWYLWPAAAVEKLKAGIALALDEVAAPLAVAVSTGDRSGLSDGLLSALERSGVTHAMAVSGLHVSYLVAFALFLTQGRRRWAIAVVPMLVFYALMVGATPSAVRAVVMQTALLAAPIAGRENDSPTSLGVALLCLLLQNPFSAASVSLQLSFAAVAGILLVGEPIHKRLMRPVEGLEGRQGPLWRLVRGLSRTVVSALSVTLGAMALAQPVIWLYFRQVSIVSPLTNLLVLWAVSILLLGGLLVGTMAALCPALAWLGLPVDPFGHYIHAVVSEVGGWRFAALDGDNAYYVLWLAAVYVVAGAMAVKRRVPRRLSIIAGCMVFLLAAAVVFNLLTVRWAKLTITALDVGQGSATALVSGGRTVLVDCGGDGAEDPGDVAADWFASFGVVRLDLLVLTHFDADHCNGVEELFARMEVGAVAMPRVAVARERMEEILALAEAEGAQVHWVTEMEEMALGESSLTLYPPLGAGASNEEGLFFTVSAGDFDALITGDADSLVENMLVRYYNIPDVELLVVGHHGAAGSTGQGLLDAVRPELAVISVGENRYGHPADEVLERLWRTGSLIYRTDQMGSVTFSIRGDGYAAQTER